MSILGKAAKQTVKLDYPPSKRLVSVLSSEQLRRVDYAPTKRRAKIGGIRCRCYNLLHNGRTYHCVNTDVTIKFKFRFAIVNFLLYTLRTF